MKVIVASPWIPAEWINAHGHEPCGIWFHTGFGALRAATGAGVCPLAARAALLAQRDRKCAFIFSTHCDQMRRAYDSCFASEPERGFLFNLPATWQSDTARKLIASELRRLGEFLVRLGGEAPVAERLAGRMEHLGAVRTELARAGEWCHGAAYARAVARFHREGVLALPPGVHPVAGGMVRAGSDRGERKAPRLAVIGGPVCEDDFVLLERIEAMGGVVVLNGTETGERTLAPHSLDRASEAGQPARQDSPSRGEASSVESLAEDLARQILDQCVDVFQRPNTRLYAWLETRLAERGVQGVILWHHVGCDLWRAESESLRAAFKLPLLLVEAGESGGVSPRNLGRVQAFLEALK